MGTKTLSQILEVSETEAAVFMFDFYKTYPAVKAFTQSVIEDCRKNGYVETLTKRRRYLPDIKSAIIAKKSEYSVSFFLGVYYVLGLKNHNFHPTLSSFKLSKVCIMSSRKLINIPLSSLYNWAT